MAVRPYSKRTKTEKKAVPETCDGMCTVTRAAQFLSVTPRTIYSLIAEGRLDAIKLGRSSRVSWESLFRLAGKRPREPLRIDHVSGVNPTYLDADALSEIVITVVREVLRKLQSNGEKPVRRGKTLA